MYYVCNTDGLYLRCANSYLEMQLNDIIAVSVMVLDVYTITDTDPIPPKTADTIIIIHLVPSVVLRDNELLTKSSYGYRYLKMQEENILTAWQTPVSVRALIGWLQVQGCRFKSWIFSSFTFFSNMLCAVKFKG